MTQVLEQQYQVQAEIPMAFMRYLSERTDERVLEVVLVYNGVDRYDTVIEPTGLRTDINTVTVDYNHRGVNTGAYLRNVRIENDYKLEDGTVLQQALVGEVHIPKDAEMFYMDREGQKRSNGNLYEAVTKGQVRSVSVEFKPYKGKQITDTKTGVTTFREWDLLRLSLLDVTPGQPYSGYKLIRSLINNNMQITTESIKTAIEAGELNKEDLRALLGDTEPTETPAVEEDDTRDIVIEPTGSEPEAPEVETPEVDTNNDGEISDEEVRSYIKDVKRMYSDPKMIKDKMDELERMCGDMKKRMDEMSNPIEPQRTQEEMEAERIRALKYNLADVPELVTTTEDDKVKRSLEIGGEEKPSEEPTQDNFQKLVDSYRKANGINL